MWIGVLWQVWETTNSPINCYHQSTHGHIKALLRSKQIELKKLSRSLYYEYFSAIFFTFLVPFSAINSNFSANMQFCSKVHYKSGLYFMSMGLFIVFSSMWKGSQKGRKSTILIFGAEIVLFGDSANPKNNTPSFYISWNRSIRCDHPKFQIKTDKTVIGTFGSLWSRVRENLVVIKK